MPAEQPTSKKKAGVKKVAGKKKKDAAGCYGVASSFFCNMWALFIAVR